uniref:C-type lectin domain-containing protein n=1 Tax=Strongyloides venezuelensis TaxID=75913 RepID=A0A0K0FZ42_STRVS
MKIIISLLFVFIIFDSPKFISSFQKEGNSIAARNCTSITKGDSYLDVVVIFDTSKGTDALGFNGQKGNVITIMSALKIGQGKKKQISRIAFITAATEAKIISDLNAYNSTQDAIRGVMQIQYTSNTGESIDIEKALKAAGSVIETSGRGETFRKVILLYSSASDYDCSHESLFASTDESPCRTAANLKNKGISIITAALQYKDSIYNPPQKGIASPCFAVAAKNLIEEFVGMFTYANCFCQPAFSQYFDTNTCFKAGECLYLENTPTGYTMAQKVANLANGTLVDIRDQTKQSFIIEIAKNSFPVFIGLNQIESNGTWKWDSGYPFDDSFNKFYNGEEKKVGMCALLNSDNLWYATKCSPYLNPKSYVYQTNACDAGNFCPGD